MRNFRSTRESNPGGLPRLILLLDVALFGFAALLPATAEAITLHVPGQVPTIQLALDAAAPDDTVLVAPGTYYGNLLWPDTQGLKLLSESGAASTILDGLEQESVCGIHVPVDTTTVLRGFTFTHGKTGGT